MKNIAVVCGGYSGESVVSMRSANMVMNNIDQNAYHATKVVITRERWYAETTSGEVDIDKNDFSFTLAGVKHLFHGVFMIVHGTPGEDGLMQGYFSMIGMPYTTGSALTMALTFNKKQTTRTLGSMGYRVAKSIVLKRLEAYSASFVLQNVGLPCFVKPNCGGSSIGTSKVNVPEELHLALDKAFREDEQVIIEEFIEGTEVTSGVITYQGEVMSLPITEIVSKKAFFDFEAKYQGASEEITPARIDAAVYKRIQEISSDIYKRLECKGMIRIDYLIRDNEPFVVEVNTVPGFSEASIIPQQAAVAGINKTQLITAVLESVGL
jgi:D-alanine-D-alanine ligase